MTRPLSASSSDFSYFPKDATTHCQVQEGKVCMTATPPPPPHCPRHPPEARTTRGIDTERASEQLSPSFSTMCTSNLAAFSFNISTTICLGWAVYSRVLRSDPAIRRGIETSRKHSRSNGAFSDHVDKKPSIHNAACEPQIDISVPLPRLPSTTCPSTRTEKRSDPQIDDGDQRTKDATHKYQKRVTNLASHDVLRKHHEYLLPWVSSQSGSPVEDNFENSNIIGNHMTDEFRQMSLRHFTDLSEAIYRDVRRREKDCSPERTPRLKSEPWTRNKHNESRMILCRTINEQFYHLVMALVLEQAQRLAQLRMKLHRYGLISK